MYLMVISCALLLLTVIDSLVLLERSPLSSLFTELDSTTTLRINKETATTTASLDLPANTTEQTQLRNLYTTPRTRPTSVTFMGRNLYTIPEGSAEIENINLNYNNIKSLPDFVFWNHSYPGLKKIDLQQNRINNIHVSAFRGLRHLKQIDLSNNKLVAIDPYTFKGNNRLEKLILMNNQISFDRLQTFLLSYSIDYLVLSNNKIDQIYELTFLGVPNLKSLVLNDNSILEIASNSFKALTKLHYLSLANTGVYRLEESMFLRLPKIINLEGTPLGAKFEPPLKRIVGDSVRNLLSLSRLIVDKDYIRK